MGKNDLSGVSQAGVRLRASVSGARQVICLRVMREREVVDGVDDDA